MSFLFVPLFVPVTQTLTFQIVELTIFSLVWATNSDYCLIELNICECNWNKIIWIFECLKCRFVFYYMWLALLIKCENKPDFGLILHNTLVASCWRYGTVLTFQQTLNTWRLVHISKLMQFERNFISNWENEVLLFQVQICYYNW